MPSTQLCSRKRARHYDQSRREFIRRFLLHVLPNGFVKGPSLWVSGQPAGATTFSYAAKLLAARSTGPPGLAGHDSRSTERGADTVDRCPRCKVGIMRMVEVLRGPNVSHRGSYEFSSNGHVVSEPEVSAVGWFSKLASGNGESGHRWRSCRDSPTGASNCANSDGFRGF